MRAWRRSRLGQRPQRERGDSNLQRPTANLTVLIGVDRYSRGNHGEVAGADRKRRRRESTAELLLHSDRPRLHAVLPRLASPRTCCTKSMTRIETGIRLLSCAISTSSHSKRLVQRISKSTRPLARWEPSCQSSRRSYTRAPTRPGLSRSRDSTRRSTAWRVTSCRRFSVQLLSPACRSFHSLTLPRSVLPNPSRRCPSCCGNHSRS